MNLLRILTVAAVSTTLIGCHTTDPQAQAKISQLREGMSQGQVKRIFGQPNKVDHDDGHHYGRGYGYVPYAGWHGGRDRWDGDEVTWEYNNPKVEVKFRRTNSGGWVVREWDAD